MQYLVAYRAETGEMIERAEASDRFELAALINIFHQRLRSGEVEGMTMTIFNCEVGDIIDSGSVEMQELCDLALEMQGGVA